MPEENIEINDSAIEEAIADSMIMVDEYGNECDVSECVVNVSEVISNENGCIATIEVYVPIEDEMALAPAGLITYTGDPAYDPTNSVKFTMTLSLSTRSINGVLYGCLSNVSGRYTVLQPGVSVTGGSVSYRSYGSGPNGGFGATETGNCKVTGTSFSKNTGFNNDVNLSGGYNFGATWMSTIIRSGNRWNFSFTASY